MPDTDDSLRWLASLRAKEVSPTLRPEVERLAEEVKSWATQSPSPDGEKPLVSPPLAKGEFGRFRFESQIGVGGYGLVYRAFDPKLNRIVAVKIPKDFIALTADRAERFVREAKAAGQLHHPNIVAIHDVGEHGGIPFIVSAFCDGPSLSEWLMDQSGPTSPKWAAECIAQVSDGVAAAHAAGVLHRDIKPSNVLLSRREWNGPPPTVMTTFAYRAMLTDFGMAKWHEADPPPPNGAAQSRVRWARGLRSNLTETGAFPGTVWYMAPERLSGKEPTPAADVYPLGVVLYELLTGQIPHRAKTPVEAIVLIERVEPVPPSRLNPQVPRDIETICLKCLNKSPERRYESAAALAADLRRYLKGDAILARPPGNWERARRWAKLHPAVATLLAIVPAIMIASIVGLFEHNRRLRVALNRAESSEAELRPRVYGANMWRASLAFNSGEMATAREYLNECIPPRPESADDRGVEWQILDQLLRNPPKPLFEFRGNRAEVYCAAYSPNRRFYVTAGKEGILRVFDADTGALKREIPAHQGDINGLAFSVAGNEVVTVGDDRYARRWNVESGKLTFQTGPYSDRLNCVAVRGDDAEIAIGGKTGFMHFLNPKDGKEVAKVSCGFVESHTYFPLDYRVLAAHSKHIDVSPQLSAFTSSGKFEMSEPSNHGGGVSRLRFHPDCSRFASAGKDGIAKIFDARSLMKIYECGGHDDRVSSVGFSRTGHFLASAGRDGGVRLWDSFGNAVGAFQAPGEIWEICFDPKADRFAIAGGPPANHVWRTDDVLGLRLAQKVQEGLGAPRTFNCALSPDGTLLAMPSKSASFALIDVATGKILGHFGDPGASERQRAMAFSPDGSDLLTAGDDGLVRRWRFQESRFVCQSEKYDASMQRIAFTPDGLSAAVLAHPKKILIFDSQTLKLKSKMKPTLKNIADLTTLPDGTIVAAVYDGTVRFWNPQGEISEASLKHRGIAVLARSLDSTLFATGGRDALVRIWDGATRECIRTIRIHGIPNSIAFSTDKKTLLVVGTDGLLSCYRVSDGSEFVKIPFIPAREPHFLGFTPNGQCLVATTLDVMERPTAFIWRIHQD